MNTKRIAVVIGTRPEAIKMAPIVRALRARQDELETVVVATAQHRHMLDQVLSLFGITPDVDLNMMRANQSLTDLTSLALQQVTSSFQNIRPDLVLVQGDTTTVFVAALAAFYSKIPVAHVEAGLRSHRHYSPFPEEANRKLTTTLSQIHFAPTPLAKQNLLHEGVPEKQIVVTGNTVVDALSIQLNAPFDKRSTPLEKIPFSNHRVLFVTSHRRESWGDELQNICFALKTLVQRFSDVIVVYPVHMNPNVRETVMTQLGDIERVYLIEPLDYLACLNLMKKAELILTDSGGVQEEAPALHKPTLVLRPLTERPEAFHAGLAKVVGTDSEVIINEVSRLLNDKEAYRSMVSDINPYGDGKASDRIVESLCRWARGEDQLLKPENAFQPHHKEVATCSLS